MSTPKKQRKPLTPAQAIRRAVRAAQQAESDAAAARFAAACVRAGLPAPERECRFHPSRGWRFDFAWREGRVALEVEGATFGMGKPCQVCGQRRGGGHTSVTGIKRDMEKYNAAAALGWRVLRTTPEGLLAVATVDLVRETLAVPMKAAPELALAPITGS